MLQLPQTLRAWGTVAFAATLGRELAAQSARLPLQEAAAYSSAVVGNIETMLLATKEEENYLTVKLGVFFSGIVAGCNCADDPTPVEPQPEYCELRLVIDKRTASTNVELVTDNQS